MKVVRLWALRTDRLYPPGNIPGTHFCYSLSEPQGHSVAGRIMSMKNCNDTIGNRTRDIPTCRVVPQPTVPPRDPSHPRGIQFAMHKSCKIIAIQTFNWVTCIFLPHSSNCCQLKEQSNFQELDFNSLWPFHNTFTDNYTHDILFSEIWQKYSCAKPPEQKVR